MKIVDHNLSPATVHCRATNALERVNRQEQAGELLAKWYSLHGACSDPFRFWCTIRQRSRRELTTLRLAAWEHIQHFWFSLASDIELCMIAPINER